MLDKNDLIMWKVKENELLALKNKLTVARAKFEDVNRELIDNISEMTTHQSEMKDVFKERAIAEYEVNGEKKLLGGLGIREGVELVFDDAHALNWAKKHSLCLSLDKSAFKKIAKTQDIDFVTKKPVITATFPSVLKFEEE